MAYIIIYDHEGTIMSQYESDNIIPPVGIPYMILHNYNNTKESGEYRPIIRIDTTTVPHSVVYGNTEEEKETYRLSLDELKVFRQRKNKEALDRFLQLHPLLWEDGLYYGITQEDQTEMIADKTAYEFKKSMGETDWKLQWHSIHSGCRNFTEEEFARLLNAIIDFVYPYRQLEMIYKKRIYDATTKEEVNAIEFTYMIPIDLDIPGYSG